MADLVGKTLGRYRVVARLGRGGMAEVYKAFQPGLERYVAIKVLHSHLVDDKDFVKRFDREAKAVSRLRHPNIVQALDFDREGDLYFMVMEFIDGPTLKEELRARRVAHTPFSLKEISRIFTPLCSAIDYAHSRNMVHRDLKPANIMINQEGQIVLTDFGIARIIDATQYTQTGALSGTPAYMSPEQGQGERGDERSDIYSLGVMLYEMVTGMVPYDADTPFAVIMKHINEPLLLPTKVAANTPESVERVILKAMSKAPEDRYQKAGEMARALRDAVGVALGEEYLPLTIVAPPPQAQQIEHSTDPVTAEERMATVATAGGGATVLSSQNATVSGTAVSSKSLPTMPLLIGGGIILFLILGGIAGAFVLSGRNGQQTDSTATQTAEAIASEQAIVMTNSEATQAAEMAAPTQTASAATAQAEAAIAKQTADAQLIAGVLSAQAATATAAAAEAEATAEAVTAEALANVTPTPASTDTPAPTDTPTPVDTPTPADTPTPSPPIDTPTPAPPPDTPTPERPAISGKLAFPIDNGSGRYDVFIISMPDGEQLGRIDGARQPNFRGDGAKLLVNGQGSSFGENILEANANGSIDRAVSGAPQDEYPFYKPDGTTLTYSNPELAVGTDGNRHPYIFVQCSLKQPSQESDKCVEMAQWNLIVPAGLIGEVQGSKPIWLASDRIAYNGCNTWAGGGSCGIFAVGSWATRRTSSGENPTKVIDGSSATPTDAKFGLIAYHSRESGNWEAYVAGENGAGIVNISDSPNSSDGLPTISPDGQWVAFASDREGTWAVYVASIRGGPAQKLFDFPKPNPWGTGGGRDWPNERMSWGL